MTNTEPCLTPIQSALAMGQNKSKADGEVQFIQETALAMGIQGDFIASKMELYMEYAAEDRLLNLEEFQELYKELSCDVIEDSYVDDYVKALFRAFDADDDGVLTFKEWRLGYLLLLMLDKEGGGYGIKEEDWSKGMEAVYRIYDVDGDKMITKDEVEYITKVITEPLIADRLYGGILGRIAREVAKMENEKLDEEGDSVFVINLNFRI